MQFQVPQFETEGKIFGPLTIGQFAYVSGAIVISIIIFNFFQFWLWSIITVLLVGSALAFALGEFNGRPLSKMILVILDYIWQPKVLSYRRISPITVTGLEKITSPFAAEDRLSITLPKKETTAESLITASNISPLTEIKTPQIRVTPSITETKKIYYPEKRIAIPELPRAPIGAPQTRVTPPSPEITQQPAPSHIYAAQPPAVQAYIPQPITPPAPITTPVPQPIITTATPVSHTIYPPAKITRSTPSPVYYPPAPMPAPQPIFQSTPEPTPAYIEIKPQFPEKALTSAYLKPKPKIIRVGQAVRKQVFAIAVIPHSRLRNLFDRMVLSSAPIPQREEPLKPTTAEQKGLVYSYKPSGEMEEIKRVDYK